MDIHELNTFSGTPGSGDYLATDNGNDTSKIPITDITGPLNARINNIIAGGDAPSEAEIVDARLGADGVTYPSLGDAIRGQVSDLKSDLALVELTNWQNNKGITTLVNEGATVNLTPIDINYFECQVVDCVARDVFIINGESRYSQTLWAFVDSDSKLISRASESAEGVDLFLIAPNNANKLIINRWVGIGKEPCYSFVNASNILKYCEERYELLCPYKGTLNDFNDAEQGVYTVSPTTLNIPNTFQGYGWLLVRIVGGNKFATLIRERGMPLEFAYNEWSRIFKTRKFACIGDSWTEINATSSINWTKMLEADGANVVNLGIGGTGFARAGAENRYIDRIASIPSDVTDIVVCASLNDMSAGVPIGTPTDTGTGSVLGYVNDFFDSLLASFSGKIIHCITTGPWKVYHRGIERSDTYIDGVETICKAKGIPFVSCYDTTNLRPWIATNLEIFYYDDSHVNNVGQNVIYNTFRAFFMKNENVHY